MLVGPWILRIQAKCSSTGIVVGRKIHSMLAVLPPHTVHTMIEYFLVCALCSYDSTIIQMNTGLQIDDFALLCEKDCCRQHSFLFSFHIIWKFNVP